MVDLKVVWKERDLEILHVEIWGNQVVRGILAWYDMLNFLENPMMKASEPLLSRFVSYWDPY